MNKDSEYVDTPNADILNTISHAIIEHKRIDAEFNERKKQKEPTDVQRLQKLMFIKGKK